MNDPAGEQSEFIRLDQFLKLAGLAATGGQAKALIQEGQIAVNGETETRRGRKLFPGDHVQFGDNELIVAADDE